MEMPNIEKIVFPIKAKTKSRAATVTMMRFEIDVLCLVSILLVSVMMTGTLAIVPITTSKFIIDLAKSP